SLVSRDGFATLLERIPRVRAIEATAGVKAWLRLSDPSPERDHARWLGSAPERVFPRGLVLSGDGRWCWYATVDGILRRLEIATGRVLATRRISQRWLEHLVLDPSLRFLIAVDWESRGLILDPKALETRASFELPEHGRAQNTDLRLSRGGDRL